MNGMKRSTRQLMDSLVTDLKPVKPLRSPGLRAAGWIAAVAVVAAALVVAMANLPAFAQRMSHPDFIAECAAALIAGLLSIVAAFHLSVPGYSPRWSWVPALSSLGWLICTGWASWHRWIMDGEPADAMFGSLQCFEFIVGVSLPLTATLFLLLRRSYPLAPLPLAAAASVGVAGIATFLLQFFHSTHTGPIDLGTHVAAVLVVISLGTLLGGRMLKH